MPAPTIYLADDFNRANSGSSIDGSYTYTVTVGSTWGITGNRGYCPTPATAAYASALPDLDPTLYTGAAVTIGCPAGSDWAAGVVVGLESRCVVVAGDGSISLVSFGLWGSTTLDSSGAGAVTVTAGDHDLVAYDNGTDIEVWWDGTLAYTAVGYSWPTPTGFGLVAHDGVDTPSVTFEDFSIVMRPVLIGELDAPDLNGGVLNLWYETSLITLPSVPAPDLNVPDENGLYGGPQAPIDVDVLPGISLGSVPAPVLDGGGVAYSYSDTPNPPRWDPSDPWPTGYQYGPPTAELTVDGYPLTTAISCQPQLNGGGTGSFTCLPPGPALGDEITYRSGGQAVFTGRVDNRSLIIVDSAEEAGQLVTLTTPGILELDWGDTTVWPDIAADQPERLGPPPQDDREWGWPMNGLVTPGLNFTKSVAGDNSRYGTSDEIFPYPDNWPDSTARWMWDRDPDQIQAPAGWCYFRVPFGSPAGDYSIFLCAYDYAKLWIDGALLIECDTAAQTKRVEVTLDGDFHLIAIAAYNAGGKAGVLTTVMQKTRTAFLAPVMNSRSNWITLGYPKHSLRATTGRILGRLVREARYRGAPAGDWTLAFTDEADSNGTPWPTGEDTSLFFSAVGSTYYDVLMQMAEDRTDFYAAPYGKTLYAFVKDTVGASLGIPWTAGVDAESIVYEVAGH